MVILLDGESKLGRVAIAETMVKKHPSWTHLALEVIEMGSPEGDEDFHLQVVKRCAEELDKDGMHLLLTLPDNIEQQRMLAKGMKPHCITVHLGNDDDSGDYDHVINVATESIKDVIALLDSVMNNDEL